jgi:serine phosphatase RsbU (regulator of sigma subunit)
MDKNHKTESIIDEINEKLWGGRFEDSHEVEKDSLVNLSYANNIQYERGIAYSKLNIAVSRFLNSRNDSALIVLTEAMTWFCRNKQEKGYPRSLLLEGNIYESFGEYEKTLSLWLESLKISKEINDRTSEGEACSQLGLVYFRLSDSSKALEYLNKGLAIREELDDENGVASSLNRIGMVLRQTKKYEESLQYYFRSLEIRKKNNQQSAMPWTLLGIASTYEDSGKPAEALEYFHKGSESSDRRCRLQCIMGEGRIYSMNGDKKKAEKMLTESLEIALDLKTLYLIAEAYAALAKHHESTGQYANALNSYKLFQETRESLLSEESQNRLKNIEVTHAIEKSEQEKEIFRLKNVELKKAYDIIEEKNKDITDSISYASRIQKALLPDPDEIKGNEHKLFILYLPRDIISGDFYWFSELKGRNILVAGDCTGHGVPGALMSMLGISFLEEIVNKRNVVDTGLILDELSREVKRALRQRGENTDSKDGMDISICIIDKKNNSIQFSGANNNLIVIRDGRVLEFRADRMPVGYNEKADKNFSSQRFTSFPDDIIYLYSDGYADQFGGLKNKKFKSSTLKDILLSIHKLSMKEQKSRLHEEFLSWKGENSQVDDVLIIGYRPCSDCVS